MKILVFLLIASLVSAQDNISDFMKNQRLFVSFAANNTEWEQNKDNKQCLKSPAKGNNEVALNKSDTISTAGNMKHNNLRHSVGSSLFMLGNFAPGEPPYFFQLSYSYMLTPNDIVYLEAITWTYMEPLGTYGSSEKIYPGKVRAYGIGTGYQRFIAGDWFMAVSATSFLQQFFNEEDSKIQSGFQLYMQLIAGYRLAFYEERIFIEPACALKYWPVNTNFPAAFAEIEQGAPKHIFEPSLNFGFRF
ncbi:MAG: hypothetical protein HUU54_16610 [Ignavibacteriaceae bacterium]|nr:hypothetical protein [Ignavibacteriaceae bacterium]